MTIDTLTSGPPAVDRIDDRDFAAIRELVYRRFGINLTEAKRNLVLRRLQNVLRRRKFASFTEYINWLSRDHTGEGLEELANRISTNHTYFYRESMHFQFFADTLLPELCARRAQEGQRELRIWCAGCSTGEEPYTLMMLILDQLGVGAGAWTTTLLATDISVQALTTAMAGVYEASRIADLPAPLRNRYFRRTADDKVEVKADLRERVIFRRHNLTQPAYPFKRPFDAIFCRNVMIYFDRETRRQLVHRYHQHLAPNGYLFVGHSESLGQSHAEFAYVMPAIYRKRPLPTAS